MVNTIRNLRTIRGLRGNGLKIDLGKTFDGTLVASMRKDSDNNTIRNFTIDSNRYLSLSESETMDYITDDNFTIENISGKWKFDVKQTVNSITKVIYTGTIYFENNVTGLTKYTSKAYIQEITLGAEDLTYTIPCGDLGVYDARIDWGGEAFTNVKSFNDVNLSYTFKSAGIYLVKITGRMPHVKFNSTGDFLKITDIPQWGDVVIESGEFSYTDCRNLIVTATDAPTITATSLDTMWQEAFLVNPKFSNWDFSTVENLNNFLDGANSAIPNFTNSDMSNVTNFNGFIRNASLANPNMSNWLIPNVTSFANAFNNSGLTTENYNGFLNMAFGQIVQSGVPLGALGINYTIATAGAAHDDLVNNDLWIINDNGGV